MADGGCRTEGGVALNEGRLFHPRNHSFEKSLLLGDCSRARKLKWEGQFLVHGRRSAAAYLREPDGLPSRVVQVREIVLEIIDVLCPQKAQKSARLAGGGQRTVA